MKIEIDFEGAIARALEPKTLGPILDKHITAAITSAIESATGYSSEFRKAMTAQLAAAVPHGLHIDDVAKFQHILNAAMQSFAIDMNNASIQASMQKVFGNIAPDVPPTLKLSELMESARGGLHKDPHEPFYAFMEVRFGDTTYISIDGNENPGGSGYRDREGQKYRASYQLAVTPEGEVFSLKFDGKAVTPSSLPNVIGSFDASLMAMYVGRTKLVIDMDDDDLEALSSEQYGD